MKARWSTVGIPWMELIATGSLGEQHPFAL